jgi:dTDP-4-amino-4,6-dideoxygalactose transaminase
MALSPTTSPSAYRVPFNRPTRTDNDEIFLRQALASRQLSGDGPFTRGCHQMLERMLGVSKALLTTSCTHALEMTAFLLNLQPGDEVIVPSFTFPSTANAYVVRGARPVFADIRPDSLCIDPDEVERLITPRTRAIVVVHYAGVACDMDAITAIAGRRGIAVVEDNAHGLFGAYKGRPLGTLSAMAALSFHETKNLTCGEGGALLINEPAFTERAEIIREKGTDRSKFFRGQVDKYGWVDVGSSYLPSELLAAVLCAQLEDHTRIQARRRALWIRYRDALDSWAELCGIALPSVPAYADQAYHMFYLVMPSPDAREVLAAHLRAHEILAVSHYVPLHLSVAGRSLGGRPGDCPVTERVADRVLRLPFFTDMTVEEQTAVIDAVQSLAPTAATAPACTST